MTLADRLRAAREFAAAAIRRCNAALRPSADDDAQATRPMRPLASSKPKDKS